MPTSRLPGGLDLRQSALVFALANICFALADTIFGQLDTIPSYLRLGRLEVLLVRPMPLLLQLVTSEVQMRRLGRLAVGVLIFLIVLPELDLSYTAGTVYLLVVTPFVGAAIYGAFFATAGGVLSHRWRRVHLGIRLRRRLRGSAAR